ncbi:hypothetical protein ACFW5S_09240 [Streptomyces olivaceus]|uniref:hypothetical protein n=1 Tax=Streptomyces olivaceus TaxID=47716 RepID=UPI00367F128F
MKRLSRPARRVLVVHVVASASWLGLTLGLPSLGATTTASPTAVETSVRSMKLFADWLLLPLALLTLTSGVVLALGTQWGLARHRWVFTKFRLTSATTVATVLALRPGVNSRSPRARPCPTRGRAGRPGRLAVRVRLHDGRLAPQALGPDAARTQGAGP